MKNIAHITSLLHKSFNRTSPIFSRTMSKTTVDNQPVLFSEVGKIGIITLNRPKALNALNLDMVRQIYPVIQNWEEAKVLILIKGTGEKSFCAGGDVRAIVEDAFKGGRLGVDFFKEEYQLNALIGTCRIPYVAFIDGIVMGGGVGLSVHGKYRIATERTMFAMPETQIGLFPDVGGSYFLPRLQGRLGWYLALTGFRLKGSDVMKAGIATHYVESKNLPALEKELIETDSAEDVARILANFHQNDCNEFALKQVMDRINNCFRGNGIDDVFENLKKDGSGWALGTLETLKKMSPTSMQVSFKELELGCNMSLQECLKMEYRLAVRSLQYKDFREGVRALLIDKDQNPKWEPSSITDVTEELVKKYFAKLPEEMELSKL